MAKMKLEHVAARAMSELRNEKGWTQGDLALGMKALGVNWTANRVTQVETLRGKLSLYEVVALTWLFEVPITRLFTGEDDVEFPNELGAVPLSSVRGALTGEPAELPEPSKPAIKVFDLDAELEETRKIAARADVSPDVLGFLSRKLWKRRFTVERDRRAGDLSGMSKRSAQTKRGHVTRAMIAEIKAEVERIGMEKLLAEYEEYELARAQEVAELLRSVGKNLTASPAFAEMAKTINSVGVSAAQSLLGSFAQVNPLAGLENPLKAMLAEHTAAQQRMFAEVLKPVLEAAAAQQRAMVLSPGFQEFLKSLQGPSQPNVSLLLEAGADEEEDQENPLDDRTGEGPGEAAGEEEAADPEEQGR